LITLTKRHYATVKIAPQIGEDAKRKEGRRGGDLVDREKSSAHHYTRAEDRAGLTARKLNLTQ
jgi:hypothetical protein